MPQVRPVGGDEFQRLATVIGVMKRDCGQPMTPRDERQPRSSRGQRVDAQPESYGDAVRVFCMPHGLYMHMQPNGAVLRGPLEVIG